VIIEKEEEMHFESGSLVACRVSWHSSERLYVHHYIAWNKPDSQDAYTSEWGYSVLVDSETRTSMLSLWNH
jgi:hypothetical protein